MHLTKVKEETALNELKFMWIELTLKCNLTCVHCYANSSPRLPLIQKMQKEDWKRVIKNGYSNGCKELQFIGGEVTLHPDLIDLADFALEIGYEFIEIYTNCTLINKSFLAFCKSNNIYLATSFYSYDEITHDTITNRKGSFKKTINGIKSILDSQIPLRIGVIEMELNRGHYNGTIDLLKSIGATDEMIGFDNLRKVGRGCSQSDVEQFEELCGHCWQGNLCISADGNVYPCVFSRNFIVGNAANSSITEVLNGGKLLSFRTRQKNENQIKEALVSRDDACSPMTDCKPNCSPCRPKCHPNTCTPAIGF